MARSGYLHPGVLGATPDTVPIGLEEIEREYCGVTNTSYSIMEMPFVVAQ